MSVPANTAWDRYRAFLEAPPLLAMEWNDAESEARGWLVINSLRGGAAGGGTRMRRGLTRDEVVDLAKAMEMKFTFSGPPIGGAKSGIDFDPADPRRTEVLRRWFRAVRPWLATCYGTAGDVAVDEQADVVPLCRELGLAHPQEGIIRGYLGVRGGDLDAVLRTVGNGVHEPVADGDLGVAGRPLVVADLITGYGVARAARRCLELNGESLEGKRVIVEGFGNVGSSCALYLSRWGASIVGLVDARFGLAAPEGLVADEVEELVRRQECRSIPEHPLRREGRDRDAAYGVEADIFVPAAMSASVGEERLACLWANGVRQIVSGANQPFAERRLGDTRVQRWADERFEIVADVVGSLGMACAFHHLMERARDPRDAGTAGYRNVFEAVGRTVDRAVERVAEAAGGRRTGLLASAVGLALEEA